MSEATISAIRSPTVIDAISLSDAFKGSAVAGWLVIAAFFGGLGGWAWTAPLNGAVVATGVVKVDGNRKSVQHLDGGIVKRLRVKEGAKVQVGDRIAVIAT